MAKRLATPDSSFPSAFNLDRQGNPLKIESSQWNELEGLLDKLSSDLTERQLPSLDDRLEWLNKSIELFWNYALSFIWCDEFEYWYYNRLPREFITLVDKFPPLCFNPNMPPEHKHRLDKVFELLAAPQTTEHPEVPAVEHVSQSKGQKKRTRKIHLVRAIESAVVNLYEKLNRKPSIDELWKYF